MLPVAPPSRLLGVLCAVVVVGLTTALVFPLRTVAPVVSLGVVYLVAVLLISTVWGAWLGVLTAIASALAFNYFHIPPTGRFRIAESSLRPSRVRPHVGRSSASLRSIWTRSVNTSDNVLISRMISPVDSDGDIARLRRIASSSCSFTRSSG